MTRKPQSRLLISVALLLIPFSIQLNVHGQKLYYGFGYSVGLVSRVNVKYDYLSEAPNFNESFKIKKQTQFNMNSASLYRIEITGGIQVKRSFFEFNLSPYYGRDFVIKATQSNYGKEEKIKKIGYRFNTSDLALRFKYVISGRKYIRTSLFTGVSEAYCFNKTTSIDGIESNFALFDWNPSFNTSLQFGTELIFNNKQANVMVSVYYEHLIKSYSDQIKVGYFYIGFRYLFYSIKQKRSVYINE